MDATLARALDWLAPQAQQLRGMRRGLEKESLRIDADGHLALTPHPAALGSALTLADVLRPQEGGARGLRPAPARSVILWWNRSANSSDREGPPSPLTASPPGRSAARAPLAPTAK